MPTAKIILKRKLKNGEYRIAIRFSHMHQQAKYVNLPYKCFPEQWDKESQRFNRKKKGFKSLNISLSEIEERIDVIIVQMSIEEDYHFESFCKKFEKVTDNRTVQEVFMDKLSELENADRIGSYITYKCCMTSLQKFTSLRISFENINYKFLKDFVHYHLSIGNKPNTIGNYLRSLRAIHYEFCKINNLNEPNIYRRFNIARFRNDTVKRSISSRDLKKLIEHMPKTEPRLKAKYVFLFSFYCRGMNLLDILKLTHDHIIGNSIIYERSKTGKQLSIKLSPEIKSILNYFESESIYLFPYIRPTDNIKFRARSINRYINEQLELICKDICVPKITIYSARHTFAELNYKAGIRIEIISQMLGHSDLKTTQTYLRSFSDDEVDNAASGVFDSLK